MNRRVFTGAALLALGLLQTGCATLVTAKAEFSQRFPWENYDKLVVRTLNGRVDLETSPSAERSVDVSGSKRAGGLTFDEAQDNLDQLEIVAHADPSDARTLVIELSYPDEIRHKNIGASLRIAAPAAVHSDISTGNGGITVRNMKSCIARTSNGPITLSDIAGDVDADTSNGRVQAERIAGRTRIDTSNGSVRLRDVGPCKIDTSNGSVDVAEMRGDLEIDTSNGSIVAQAAPGADGRVDLSSSNGSIRLTLPTTLKGRIELSTSNGRIEQELGPIPLQNVKLAKHAFSADINGGGTARVIVRTTNGGIRFDCR
jgi:DUF4097 and DUF4098 domain-containing protein YvlB